MTKDEAYSARNLVIKLGLSTPTPIPIYGCRIDIINQNYYLQVHKLDLLTSFEHFSDVLRYCIDEGLLTEDEAIIYRLSI